MGLKKIVKNVGIKGVFNTVFPKAENSKIGKIASGIINGASQATPLSFIQDFAKDFFDTDGDGKLTAKDFKDMDAKTFGKAIGFVLAVSLSVYLFNKYSV